MLDGLVLLPLRLRLRAIDWTLTGLWLSVIASGLFHGLNPAMGWPLAVSAGLMERNAAALLYALTYLAGGHLLAMLVIIVPFAVLTSLLVWQREIQIAASMLVTGYGVFQLAKRRHPRILARISPRQLGLWSFAIAIAHGAGLMLLPVYLGLCKPQDADMGHAAAGTLINANLTMALIVSIVHSVAMIAASGALAWLVYRYLGLRIIARSWFNLDAVWAMGLILAGATSLVINTRTIA